MLSSLRDLPQKKVSELHLSASNPPMYLSIESNEFDKNINTFIYNIEIGIQNSPNTVQTHTIKARYSTLHQLDQQLQAIYKEKQIVNPFPPKNYFRNNSEAFVRKRQESLQHYLDVLTRTPEIISAQPFRNFFQISDVNT